MDKRWINSRCFFLLVLIDLSFTVSIEKDQKTSSSISHRTHTGFHPYFDGPNQFKTLYTNLDSDNNQVQLKYITGTGLLSPLLIRANDLNFAEEQGQIQGMPYLLNGYPNFYPNQFMNNIQPPKQNYQFNSNGKKNKKKKKKQSFNFMNTNQESMEFFKPQQNFENAYEDLIESAKKITDVIEQPVTKKKLKKTAEYNVDNINLDDIKLDKLDEELNIFGKADQTSGFNNEKINFDTELDKFNLPGQTIDFDSTEDKNLNKKNKINFSFDDEKKSKNYKLKFTEFADEDNSSFLEKNFNDQKSKKNSKNKFTNKKITVKRKKYKEREDKSSLNENDFNDTTYNSDLNKNTNTNGGAHVETGDYDYAGYAKDPNEQSEENPEIDSYKGEEPKNEDNGQSKYSDSSNQENNQGNNGQEMSLTEINTQGTLTENYQETNTSENPSDTSQYNNNLPENNQSYSNQIDNNQVDYNQSNDNLPEITQYDAPPDSNQQDTYSQENTNTESNSNSYTDSPENNISKNKQDNTDIDTNKQDTNNQDTNNQDTNNQDTNNQYTNNQDTNKQNNFKPIAQTYRSLKPPKVRIAKKKINISNNDFIKNDTLLPLKEFNSGYGTRARVRIKSKRVQ